jgi:hypothetical protein
MTQIRQVAFKANSSEQVLQGGAEAKRVMERLNADDRIVGEKISFSPFFCSSGPSTIGAERIRPGQLIAPP